MITSALDGSLDNVDYVKDAVFGLSKPVSCIGVPTEILDSKNTWENKEAYDKKAAALAESFVINFNKFKDTANQEILDAAPRVKLMA